MKDLSVLQLFPYALFLITTIILCTSPPASSAAGLISMRADLTHVDSGRGFTNRELLDRMFARSRARASLHQQRGRGGGSGGHRAATIPAAPAVSEYNVHFAIGTPRPQRVALTLDTGSDLVWTQCTGCQVCFDQAPATTPFDTSASATIRDVPCSDPICGESNVAACYIPSGMCFYLDSYGDNATTAGSILRDTFVFRAPDGKPGGAVVVPGLAFGCGYYNTGKYGNNESGIAGFGRGRQSLPSQLNVRRFSYCLTPYGKKTISPVFLGTPDDLRAHATGPIRSTPFVHNAGALAIPSYYYLPFTGITVGETRLPVDESVFALRRDGSGGTIIDSGTSITTFPQAVYDELRRAFLEQVRLPVYRNASDVGDDTLCFSLPRQGAPAPAPPKLVFHLAGADMDLPPENYMMVDRGTGPTGVMCLAVAGAEGDMTLIGNYQQQNMHIVYDLESNRLFFVPAECDKM
ncbi:hypothetical protein ACP4OV_017545 [Aristida adscensionis]